jgi:mono/diheme cytochrome c family protein
MKWIPPVLAPLIVLLTAPAWGQTGPVEDINALPAPEVYRRACAACHGPDGRGYPGGEWRERTGLQTPPPDFTDPRFNSREPLADWVTVIRDGGRALGLSPQMPAFGLVLSEAKIRELAEYLKGLGRDDRYPPGELNFYRGHRTTKAFPEDEFLLISNVERLRSGNTVFQETLYYAHRVGPRYQWEIKGTSSFPPGEAMSGEVEGGFKWVVAYSLARRWIFTVGLEPAFPVRSDEKWSLSLYGTWGKALGERWTLQSSLRLRWSPPEGSEGWTLRWSGVLHGIFTSSRRGLFPALEWTVEQGLHAGAQTRVWLLPQAYVALSRRGHVAFSIGPEIPVHRDPDVRFRVRAFLLWDYADGPFWHGW